MLRPDYIFSFWIYLFWIIYIFKIYREYNPKLLLLIGVCFDIVLFFFMLYYKTNIYKIVIPFIFVIIFIKIIPLYTLRKNTIKIQDLYFSTFLFIIYFFWLRINNISFEYIFNEIKRSVVRNIVSPLF